MLKNLTIAEFEAMVTTRVIAGSRMVDRKTGNYRTRYPYATALMAAAYTANDIFKEIGANEDLWCMLRGRRAFIFHKPTKRIAAELGVAADKGNNGLIKRMRVLVLDRKGYVKVPTIGELAIATDRLGPQKPNHARHNHLEIKK